MISTVNWFLIICSLVVIGSITLVIYLLGLLKRVQEASEKQRAKLKESEEKIKDLIRERVTFETVRLKEKQQLTETEEAKRLQFLKEIPEGLFIVDRERKIFLFNKMAEQITGWKESEVLGKYCGEIFKSKNELGESVCEGECPLVQAMEKGETIVHKNNTILLNNSRELPVSSKTAPFYDSSGQLKGALCLFTDISERKKSERLRDEFVTNVSHELRTPLTVIKGYAEILTEELKGEMGTQMSEFAKVINEQCERLERILEGILSFKEAQAWQIGLRRENVNIIELLQENILAFEPRAAKKKIAIISKLPESLSPVRGDCLALRFVFDQLLDNAIKFTPEGGKVMIETGGVKLEDTVWKMEISVIDTGMGIASEDIPHIFERFYRSEQKVHTLHGTGIGLSMVKEIVETHGGTIAVESELGRGSKFIVRLPMGE
ncbi:MAG: ATP-binding protein [Candidatus Edwardsbacteria bacterium]